jgi:tetratricopeptide (TPR) repeat protein
MQKISRFLFLPLAAIMLSSNAAYAGNHEAEYYLSNGEAQLNAGKYKEAVSIFTKAIEYEPKLSRTNLSAVYFKRGLAKLTMGDQEGAKKDYRMSIELDRAPKDAEAYYNRGIAKTTLGDSEGAKADFRRASMLGYNNNKQMQQYNDAKNTPFGTNSEANSFLYSGKLKLGSGDYKGAIADFTKSIELDQKLAAAYFNRGIAKGITGDSQGRLADFRKTIEVDPTPINAEAYYNRGTAKSFIGDNNGALTDYTKAIDLNPAHGEAYHQRGKIKETMGDKEGATLDYKQSEKFQVILPSGKKP